MKIAVIGSGAMGCLFGGKLQLQPENDVTLLDAWPAHVEQLSRHGLTMGTDEGEVVIPIKATLPSEAREAADLVIVFTKSMHTASALETAKAAIGPDSMVLTLQNGLGNIEKIAQHVPMANIVAGVTTMPSDLAGPGRINSHGVGKTTIGSALPEGAGRAKIVADLLNRAGLETIVCEDILSRIWGKVAFNSALTHPVRGHGASRRGNRPVRNRTQPCPQGRGGSGLGGAKEGFVRRSGGKLGPMVAKALDEHGSHKPSMLQDILSKRETEIDTIAGGAVAEAEALGMAVPTTAVLADLVRTIQHEYLK